jgi:hypothetical protein
MRLRFALLAITICFFAITPLLLAAGVSLPGAIGDISAISNGVSPKPDLIPQNVLNESGYLGGDYREYQSGERKIQLTLYKFRDSSGAYEAYSFLRPVASSVANSIAVNKSNLVLLVVGNITNEEELAIGAWEQKASDGVTAPPIASYLPSQDRAPNTDRYALGPAAFGLAAEVNFPNSTGLKGVAGFDSHAEAMFAKYKAGKDEATLLLIEYPTPQLAEMHLRHLQRGLRDAKLSTSSIERKGSLLSIVLAPTSAEYAEKLRGSVNYETEVTWNEPSTTATDPPITSTLVKIIIATMVLMGMAFVLGIAFGGVRVITKRLFPGKVFDRPAQMEVLQLGLSGKPIDPRDMY